MNRIITVLGLLAILAAVLLAFAGNHVACAGHGVEASAAQGWYAICGTCNPRYIGPTRPTRAQAEADAANHTRQKGHDADVLAASLRTGEEERHLAPPPRTITIPASGYVGSPAYGTYTAPAGKRIVGFAYRSHTGALSASLSELGPSSIRLTALGGGIVGTSFTCLCQVDVVEE